MFDRRERSQDDCGVNDRVDAASLRLQRARHVGKILSLRGGEVERQDRRLRVAGLPQVL